jgi:CBS domain-containing membrane protein
MTGSVLAVRPEDDLATLRDLMFDYSIRHVPVVDGERHLVGLVTHRDLLRNSLIEQRDIDPRTERAVLADLRVSDIMTQEVEQVAPDTDVREAAQTMVEKKYGCLPVVLEDRLVGIVTESDFVRVMARGN